MDDQDLIVGRAPGNPAVMTIRLNRAAKKNAITRRMYAGMKDALAVARSNDALHAVLFLGAPGCFSAGNDLAEFLEIARGASGGGDKPVAFEFLRQLATFDKPLIAAVDGLAVGIGATISLHCDLTFATRRSVFSAPFVDLGLVPEAGSSLLVPRLMGHQRAFGFLAAGEPLPAEDAWQRGLVYRLVDEASLEAEALAMAGRLCGKPREALLETRRLLRGSRQDVLDRIDEEADLFNERLRSAETVEALSAFLDRRR